MDSPNYSEKPTLKATPKLTDLLMDLHLPKDFLRRMDLPKVMSTNLATY